VVTSFVAVAIILDSRSLAILICHERGVDEELQKTEDEYKSVEIGLLAQLDE